MPIALGIDTGGTYTDAVLVDFDNGAVLAKAKALTTKHDLVIGVRQAMARVLAERPTTVGLVSLSTTLATNALVEGQGSPVAALLIGYAGHWAPEDAQRELNTTRIAYLAGGHTTDGEELAPLDEAAARRAIAEHAPHVAAFAISGYFGTRNPAHELAVQRLVREMTGLPTTCGHELTQRLNAPRRATTVTLNASLIPLICALIAAVEQAMAEQGLHAPLMVVKGDGSLMAAEVARERPIETILSGPAASVVGAQYLAQRQGAAASQAMVVDMGGTTTDIALLQQGRPALSPRGARVGRWHTMVEAIAVRTVGLGGDSRVWLDAERALQIGPRRAIPLCLLAAQYPTIADHLAAALASSNGRHAGEFYCNLRDDWRHDGEAPAFEPELRAALAERPLTLDEIHAITHYPSLYVRYLEMLERRGTLIRASLTPTDAAHALALYSEWDAAPARLGAELMARRLRISAEALCQEIVARTAGQIALHLAAAALMSDRAEAERAGDGDGDLTEEELRLLAVALSDQSRARLEHRLRLHPTLTAIGAPVGTYLPRAAAQLQAELLIPEHAEVANAIGAVVGSVVARAHVSIVPRELAAGYRAYTPEGADDFATLDEAVAVCEARARAWALTQASRAGAAEVHVQVERVDQHAPVGDGWGDALHIQTVLHVTATGRPRAVQGE